MALAVSISDDCRGGRPSVASDDIIQARPTPTHFAFHFHHAVDDDSNEQVEHQKSRDKDEQRCSQFKQTHTHASVQCSTEGTFTG
jgi:hypothetical protein